MAEAINVADLKNPATGKTYREENNALSHNIPLGALVEVWDDCDEAYNRNGLRLFVVEHNRDCDGTPLYSLSFNKNWNKNMYGEKYEFLAKGAIDSGYPEEWLRVIDITNK